MTALRFCALSGVVILGIGCSKEKTFTEPLPPLAAIHFLNAVPDTMQLDFRVVDIVSNAGFFDANFRDGNMFYTGIEAGSREIRVFLSSTNPSIASQVMWDSTLNLTAATNYTLIQTGFARTGQAPARAALLLTDNPAAPGAGNIGLRVVNAGAGLGNVDVNVTRHATDTLPDTPLLSGVVYGTTSVYLTLPVDAAAADSSRVVITAAGTKAPVLATVKLPAGLAGTATTDPIAGARVAGSVLSAVVVPRSVAGSLAPQTAPFLVPTAVFLVDRRP
ncbi:MAG TPA: DUF4397 domain-containing protein [Gemmatimonadales bacterium]|nr:DUF4397 domain-containing protein [Gemmatimonadales bacterium]